MRMRAHKLVTTRLIFMPCSTADSQILTNLSEYGNTSAGSIPLALDEAVRAGKVKKGDVIACAGFGAGLSWGSAILRYG